MKQFMRITAAVLTVILGALAFAGCDGDGVGTDAREGTGVFGPHGVEHAAEQVFRFVYTAEATHLNPWNTADSLANSDAVTNGSCSLLRICEFGIIREPALAERFYMSEDGMTWHFHIRQGLQWVDHTITPVGYLTADCFVAVMEWVLTPENMSVNTHNFMPRVKNSEAFFRGEVGLEEVGFRALDRYLLEIELEFPVPYFIHVAGFQPAYRPFLDAMGRRYGTCNETKLYIGPFVMTEFSPGFRRIWERNPYHWDAENVFIERAIGQHNAEAGLLAPELFRRGEIEFSQITSDIVDMWLADPVTGNLVNPGIPAIAFQWYFMFNFNPQFAAEFEPENWDIAVNNTAFRQSIFWAIDPLPALMTLDPFNAHLFLSNSISPRGHAIIDGVDFVDMEPLSRFHQYPNWLFYPERALRYRDQAIEELTAAGATFPIILYMRYNPGTPGWALEVQVVAQHLVELLGADYIRPVIETGSAVDFLGSVRRTGDYGFMKGNNGNVAFGDPSSWVFAFRGVDDSWIHWLQATGEETQRIRDEYFALLEYANTHTTAGLERWQAFNNAEYHLLSHAIVRPFYNSGGLSYWVYRFNPFAGARDFASWNGRILFTEPITNDQWQAFYADWRAGQAAAIAAQQPIPIIGR